MSGQIPVSKTIIITGDVTIDWNLIFFQSAHDLTSLWNVHNTARACPQPGGVAMLSALIQAVCARLPDTFSTQIYSPRIPLAAISTDDKRLNHSYVIWELQGDKEKKGWRVSQFLGTDAASEDDERLIINDPPNADLIVLDDANLGLRHSPGHWPNVLQNLDSKPWIILKLSPPVAQGELLSYLTDHFAERVIAVVSADDLRLSNAQISRGLSWERIAQDTLWELSYNPELSLLSKCEHVIVSYQTDGAVLLSHTGQDLTCQLVFDPNTIEKGWSAGYKGGMVGFNTCLTAAIARYLLVNGEPGSSAQAALAKGIHAGLSAMRVLHSKGYQNGGSTPQEARIAFPYQLVASDIENPTAHYAQTQVRDPLGVLSRSGDQAASAPRTGMFTILSQQCCDDLITMARSIVKNGPEKALSSIPLGRFGKLLTVDRSEIESYRTIAALVQEYIDQEKVDKPISIAVFGAPGSGKSFGIKEIANSLSDRIKEITFNLSQMNSPDDLIGALHQVRDEALRGRIPLVFWDEFDASLGGTPLGWLRYFLSPMQDGSFLEGQVTHPIGRAIFVFAGGTCERMEEFGKRLDEDPRENEKLFRAVKGPDFKSRLKGFINILGPNPQKGVYDPYFIIRRAILLNSLLRRLTPQFFTPALQMDDPLLDAFLEVSTYLHGVRSMESIISMSQLAGKTRFERSCLPPVSQLNLHVIGWEFMARVQKLKFEGEALEKLAHAVHEDFCEYMREKGYVFGEKTDESANPKTHSSLLPFDQLLEGEQEQNKQFALDIPRKLAQAGYVMIHARTNEPPRHFPDTDLDVLAEMEHIRWVKVKLAQPGNWRFGKPTDKPNHLHADLLPWRKMTGEELANVFSPEELAAMGREILPEAEKEKDRQLVRRIPFILGRVGYTVVKLDSGG
jgi:hypothetical protein